GLIFKLIKYKFPTHLIKLIWNMIDNRKFQTTDGHHKSDEYLLPYYSKTIQDKLQKTFDLIRMYSNNWRLKINDLRCETILFRPKLEIAMREVRRNWKNFSIKSNNVTIPHKNSVRYLGVQIDQHLR
ncbi:GSCOCG00011075001-RA-CDS, partial [Cotesia congregata]